ncbi:hypothetical protein [Paraburkholderia phenazinium]|uniref:hypothetical protein n=2 Tax=Paraburkholderia phenazinium TaxID=60549 RepID=UPI001FC8B35A|nr:hypothetical protein [Paraburkholderia phenazinium]
MRRDVLDIQGEMMSDEKIQANVYVATPSYGAVVATDYVLGLLDLYDVSASYGFGLRVHFNSFDSLITRARNTMVAEFLADDRFTHLMWIDGDIGFKGTDVVRLLKANRPVVAGVYPLKSDGWPRSGLPEALPAGTTKADFQARFASYPAVARSDNLEADADGFLDALYAPTGFMLIKREVFLALMRHFPELQCSARMKGREEDDTGVLGALHYAFFDTMIDPQTRTYLSEDYAFCRRIASIGITPAVDTRSNFTHQGVAVFRGDLERSLNLQRLAARGGAEPAPAL